MHWFLFLAIIKDPSNDIYCITEEPSKHYLQKKFHLAGNLIDYLLYKII